MTTNHNTCLLCSSGNLKELEPYIEVGLVKCSSCNFIFSQKIPSKEELLDYYSNNYERTNYLSPITVKRFNEILDTFEPFKKTGKLLDVGAGYGFFMEVARERGWDVYGTELTDEAVEYCEKKGLQMFQGELHELDLEKESFDVIVSIEVIEHVNTPVPFVKKAHQLLRKGGIVYLTTPNFNSLLRYRLKEQYNVIEYPNHLCYYTPETLKNLFQKEGFLKLNVKTTGISLTRLRTSQGKSDQEFVCETSDDEMLRYRIEKNSALKLVKSSTNGILNLLKVGDSLKGYFQKR